MKITSDYYRATAYIAARFGDKAIANEAADVLNKAGVAIISSWLMPSDNQSTDEIMKGENVISEARSKALIDFSDIDNSDIFILLLPVNGNRGRSGGKDTELGYALAKGKACFVVGERRNIFHYHPAVRLAATVEDVINMLGV